MNISLDPDLIERMLVHAKSVYPQEACGFLVGYGTDAQRFLPLPNRLASEISYEIEPSILASTFRSLRETGEQLVAIVHSHPRGPSEPSKYDRERAFYPEAAHVIISLADMEHPEIRAFRIIDGEAYEIELQTVI